MKLSSVDQVHVGSGYYTSNPLPDVFLGLKIHLRPEVGDKDRLRRYMVGYGAEEVTDWSIDTATHIVYPPGRASIGVVEITGIRVSGSDPVSCPASAHVSVQWLIDSVKLKKVQDVNSYKL